MDNVEQLEVDATPNTADDTSTRASRRANILAGLTVGALVIAATTIGAGPTPTLATLG